MPIETKRTTARKGINVGSGVVYIPVIQSIQFKDDTNRGQQSLYTFDNDVTSSRVAHSHTITASSGDYIQVERIDEFKMKDDVRRGQQFWHSIYNNDPPPATESTIGQEPHNKVHYIRYYASNVQGGYTWVDVEVIDELHVKDDVQRGQQTHFILTGNPPAGTPEPNSGPYYPTFAECDPSLQIVNAFGGTLDPPYRLDPFQNIVRIGTFYGGYGEWIHCGYYNPFVTEWGGTEDANPVAYDMLAVWGPHPYAEEYYLLGTDDQGYGYYLCCWDTLWFGIGDTGANPPHSLAPLPWVIQGPYGGGWPGGADTWGMFIPPASPGHPFGTGNPNTPVQPFRTYPTGAELDLLREHIPSGASPV